MEVKDTEVEDEMLVDMEKDADDDENDAKKEDLEYETKDVVKKYQFEYNKSLCMSDKYPEVSANEKYNISVAPGEGKIPKDIMNEEDWDIKAFPNLNNPDGSNGKDHERKTRLTDQKFFIHRICNNEKRFARSPAFMYAAIRYLERKKTAKKHQYGQHKRKRSHQ